MKIIDIIVLLILAIWMIIAVRSYKKQKNGCQGNCLHCLLMSETIKTNYKKEKEE